MYSSSCNGYINVVSGATGLDRWTELFEINFINKEMVLPQMQCRFVVYTVPWEKRKDLLSHECVGLEEKIMTCERSNPVEAKSEPDENNMVKEILIEPVKVHVHCTWIK